ncbi:hypothetical protein WKH56_19500 [Priestia sp. SB1]|uniref:hypothetical protein n=1 Tax=Priestia sp. SB1 TaxID=3132359 RepID=UPI00316CF7C9
MGHLNIKTTSDATNHLLHRVKEVCGEEKAKQLEHDIKETMLGSNVIATKGSIENMRSATTRRFAAEKRVKALESQNYDLIIELEQLESKFNDLMSYIEKSHTTYSE